MTLDPWVARMAAAKVLECPIMHLIGRDHEDPLFVGAGEIDTNRVGRMSFIIEGKPNDPALLFNRLHLAEQDRYGGPDQLRLVAIDREGVEWSAGWTRPRLKNWTGPRLVFIGELTALCAIDQHPSASVSPGVELVFRPGFFAPMDVRDDFVSPNDLSSQMLPVIAERRMHILGSEVTVFERYSEHLIWLTATTSETMQHPLLENWLSEPLRILHGQLIYPWLVARNLGNRGSMVWVRPSRVHSTESYFAGLLSIDPARAHTEVWEFYERLLKLIATPLIFGTHTLTQYYEEIIQATVGSRWVLCLTLASAAEGIAKILMSPEDRKRDFSDEDMNCLKEVIRAWSGNAVLRDAALSLVGGARDKSVRSFFIS